jgi:hypothetical protein
MRLNQLELELADRRDAKQRHHDADLAHRVKGRQS